MKGLEQYRTGNLDSLLNVDDETNKVFVQKSMELAGIMSKHITLPLPPESVLLDLGAGTGSTLVAFGRALGIRKMIAVDGVDRILPYTKSNVQRELNDVEIQTVVADLERERLAIDNDSVTIATAIMLAGYLESLENLVSETNRVLKSQGFFVLTNATHAKNTRDPIVRQMLGLDFYIHSDKRFENLISKFGLKVFWQERKQKPFEDTTVFLTDYILQKK